MTDFELYRETECKPCRQGRRGFAFAANEQDVSELNGAGFVNEWMSEPELSDTT